MKRLKFCLITLSIFLFHIEFGFSQTSDISQPGEAIEIIVTTNTITIDANFTGKDVYIAGVLENADPLLRRQNRYDIIVVMEGPIRSMVMRQKKRKAGVWVNADAITFKNVPMSYLMATTREVRDITNSESYQRLGLGIDHLPLRTDSDDFAKEQKFRSELLALKEQQNLYSETVGAVNFGSAALFTAHFRLPTNIPVGQHKVHAYLFKDSTFIQSVSTDLEIVKAHLAYTIYRDAHVHSFWYGLVAVLVAIATGFFGRLIFRKD